MPDRSSFTTRSRGAKRDGELSWGDTEHPWEDEIEANENTSIENGSIRPFIPDLIPESKTLPAGTHDFEGLRVESNVTVVAEGDHLKDENGEFGGVKIVSTDDVIIEGTIDAREQGYPAGYDGPGTPKDQQYSSGSGYGGLGGGTYDLRDSGYTYGDPQEANRLGSGSDYSGANAGGGSVWIVSLNGDIILNGEILADAMEVEAHGASGGSIRLEADGEILGNGTVSATGASVTDDQYAGAGGGGRILFLGTDNSTITADVSGGVQPGGGYDDGADGHDGSIVR
jgi:hypothetical protein